MVSEDVDGDGSCALGCLEGRLGISTISREDDNVDDELVSSGYSWVRAEDGLDAVLVFCCLSL